MIEKIDGDTIAADMDPSKLLNRKYPSLPCSMFDPKTNTRWDETVKPCPVGNTTCSTTVGWSAAVWWTSLSGGKLGYVHVEGMDDGSYRTVYEEALGRYHDRQGLVVDTLQRRWLVARRPRDFLSGKVYMREEPRG